MSISDINVERRQILLVGAGIVASSLLPGCGKTEPKTKPVGNGNGWRVAKPNLRTPVLGWETLKMAGANPGARSRHGLVYDPINETVIMFGGVEWSEDGFSLYGDTWEMTGNTWREVRTRVSPPHRFRAGMVFLRNSNQALLFGGFNENFESLGDTWLYSNRRWRQLPARANPAPSKRGGHCLAFDETANVAVLFGGTDDEDKTLSDTWIFDGNEWKRIETSGPPARRYASLAYHPDLGGCLLHGGAFDDNGDVTYGDAWLFKDQEWTRLPESHETSKRDDHGLIYHRTAKQMIMLEGVSGERGILALGDDGWKMVDANPLHPRHQATPLVWHEAFNGVLMYGGEEYHGGPQFETTLLLHMPSTQ